MKKNIKCISEAISFLSENFLYVLYITLPVMLVLALCLTLLPPLAIVPFLLLQGIMFRLLGVKNSGYEVRAQRYKSVYKAAFRNVGFVFSPKKWGMAVRYLFGHFREFASLSLCCLCFYGVIAFFIAVPQLTIRIIQWAISLSAVTGDRVELPSNLSWTFFAVLFVVNYLLSILLADSLLPFPLRRAECQKEDAELETIVPKA
jgi:hypothetical protein